MSNPKRECGWLTWLTSGFPLNAENASRSRSFHLNNPEQFHDYHDTMPDMYAIQSSKATSEQDESIVQYTPNIIPCRVHHDGPVDSLDRYWMPVEDEKGTFDPKLNTLSPWNSEQSKTKRTPQYLDNTQTVHFRGRKLRGRRVALPDGYQGMNKYQKNTSRPAAIC